MILLDYSVKITPIDNGDKYWKSTLCEIYKGEEKIGEYKRGYPSHAKDTFFAFSSNGKDFALFSSNYQKISLMSLPDCKEIELKKECIDQMTENGKIHFCPAELYIPTYSYTTVEKYRLQSQINTLEREKGDEYEYSYGYSKMGFAVGCVWGDDSSFKLMLLDLRKIEDGELWFIDNTLNKNWLYEDFPDSITLKDIEVFFDDDSEVLNEMPCGYRQLIQKYIHF